MAKDAKVICPMMGGEECVEDGAIRNGELVTCRFWINVQGKHPQTGQEISNGDCAIAWTPMLMIENSKVNRETGASIESFRNEMVKANHRSLETLLAANKQINILENK
tara:strand:- start:1866 stop:2189 length:324 start_codon:yes stop_codon:yes gene_type:complete